MEDVLRLPKVCILSQGLDKHLALLDEQQVATGGMSPPAGPCSLCTMLLHPGPCEGLAAAD